MAICRSDGAMWKPFLGKDQPNKNNKLGIRNLRVDPRSGLYICQATVLGVRKHIACFHDLETAKSFVDTMHTFDLNDADEVDQFWKWARSYREERR